MILLECPVCKYLALTQRVLHETCPVCGWEDEVDEDSWDASKPTFGPNGNESLNQARERFESSNVQERRDYKRVDDLTMKERGELIKALQKEISSKSSHFDNPQHTDAVTYRALVSLLKKLEQ